MPGEGAYEGMSDEEIEAEEEARTSDTGLTDQYDKQTGGKGWRGK